MHQEEWDWLRVRNRFENRMTELPPTPDVLLKVIRCSCRNDFDTRRCSCKKHRRESSIECGECKCISCTNSHMLHIEDVDDTKPVAYLKR